MKLKFIQKRRLRDRQIAVMHQFGVSLPQETGHQYPDKQRSSTLKTKAKSVLRTLMPINLKFNRPAGADIIYCWGCIPIFGRYVVDLDNVYSLSGYNLNRFRISRIMIALLLSSRRCVSIRAISFACKQSINCNFGPKVSAKTKVVYPCEGLTKVENKKKFNGKIMFVGSQFDVKGGKILSEFIELVNRKFPEYTFTIVSHVPEPYRECFERNKTVTVLKPDLSRKSLLRLMKTEASVLFHPSLMESFGMVMLEATSVGLPVLSFDYYNLPEIVRDGCNGFNVALNESKWDGVNANPKNWHSARYYNITDSEAKRYANLFLEKLEKLVNEYELFSSEASKHYEELSKTTLKAHLEQVADLKLEEAHLPI